MAETIMAEPPPPPDPTPYLYSEFDSLAIPPFDHLYLSGCDQVSIENLTSDLEFVLGDNEEFELTFDSMDDLYFPAENESFLIPDVSINQEQSGDFTPESEGCGISGDRAGEDVDKYLNCLSSAAGGCDRRSPKHSGYRCSGAERSLICSSPISSQGSGNCGSGASEATNRFSPESGNLVVDQKVKVDEPGTTSTAKRKKENEEDTSGESRNGKCRRSGENVDTSAVTCEEDEKRKARLERNRESAQLSRQRKKHYVEELEEKVRTMRSTISELNSKISYFMAENATLRQQLCGGAGLCLPHHPPPPPGMYPPMAPMAYPWVPCPPYMVKTQGSQVPLIPIPRLKPRQALPASKAKKPEGKKGEARTKKVASISFLGLLFCLFLFGALAPIVNITYGGIDSAFYGDKSNYVSDRLYDQHRGRVLDVNSHLNGSDHGGDKDFPNSDRAQCNRGSDGGVGRTSYVTDKFVSAGNGSEPLVASLFVPRNDKLVKIDGNLIIHSIMASEKALFSQAASETNKRKTNLAIPKEFSPALTAPGVGRNGDRAKHLYRTNTEKPKALSSGPADNLKDHFKSTAANGKMQQWFREGLAGPMLSSGMCTEVFQFDASPTSGAIVTASSATNISTEHGKNSTNTIRGRYRRILRGLPVPFPGPDFNLTRDKENFRESKPSSSMVVSVLVDPREGGDSNIDGVMGPKSLSRVFVVVLVDSVKYVTYSCGLPRSGGGPHLVTT